MKRWGGTKALIVYGGGSAVRSGFLGRVEESLEKAGIAYAHLGGVQPNPRLALAEALLRVTVENGRVAIENPCDYHAMSEIMWCGSLSHNDITGLGRTGKDFSVHKFGHALSRKYDYAHGATLSAVRGSWAEYIYDGDVERFAHYAEKVRGVQNEDKEAAAKEGIRKTVEYFKEIGMPTTLSELGFTDVSDEELMELAMHATKNGTNKLALIKKWDLDAVLQIFKNAR